MQGYFFATIERRLSIVLLTALRVDWLSDWLIEWIISSLSFTIQLVCNLVFCYQYQLYIYSVNNLDCFWTEAESVCCVLWKAVKWRKLTTSRQVYIKIPKNGRFKTVASDFFISPCNSYRLIVSYAVVDIIFSIFVYFLESSFERTFNCDLYYFIRSVVCVYNNIVGLLSLRRVSVECVMRKTAGVVTFVALLCLLSGLQPFTLWTWDRASDGWTHLNSDYFSDILLLRVFRTV